MKKNYVQNIIIHEPDNMDINTIANKVNRFHVEVIERRLNQSNLTLEEKIDIIEKIIKNLKLREVNSIIK